MSRPARIAVVISAVAVFVVASLGVGRILAAQGAERTVLEGLIRNEASGDLAAVARSIDDCPAGTKCFDHLARVVRRVALPGERLEILQIDSGAGFSPGGSTSVARLAWHAGTRLPTVQCVVLSRRGSVVEGFSIAMRAVSMPIARDGACPDAAAVIAASR